MGICPKLGERFGANQVNSQACDYKMRLELDQIIKTENMDRWFGVGQIFLATAVVEEGMPMVGTKYQINSETLLQDLQNLAQIAPFLEIHLARRLPIVSLLLV
jgi:hypothetical protein